MSYLFRGLEMIGGQPFAEIVDMMFGPLDFLQIRQPNVLQYSRLQNWLAFICGD